MKNNYNIKNNLFVIIILSCIIFCNGCISPQVAQVTLVENFQQSFNFNELKLQKNSKNKNKFIGKMLQIDGIKDKDKFSDLISSPEGEKISNSLNAGNVKTDGNVTLVISLNPYNKNKFTITGGGNFEIFDTITKQIYFSSTFHVIDCDGCSDIKRIIKEGIEFLEISFTQVAINQFDYPREGTSYDYKYKHTPVEPFKVKIKIKKYGKKRFSLDYGSLEKPTGHDVLFKEEIIGKLYIIPLLGPKIIDMRGRSFIRNYNNIK